MKFRDLTKCIPLISRRERAVAMLFRITDPNNKDQAKLVLNGQELTLSEGVATAALLRQRKVIDSVLERLGVDLTEEQADATDN